MCTAPETYTYIGLSSDDITRMQEHLPTATFHICPQRNSGLFDVEVVVYPIVPDTSYLSNGRILSRNY